MARYLSEVVGLNGHRVSITTLGCKSNQCDSFFIQNFLEKKGFRFVRSGEPADICIINTCTVTGKSDFQSRQEVRRAIKNNPGARIVVTGCYAVSGVEELRRFNHQAEVVPPQRLFDFLNSLANNHNYIPPSQETESSGSTIHFVDKFYKRTRAFFKIQDGCNLRCSYCIVPFVRGRSRSLPLIDVLRGLKRYKDSGYKEVVLTGVHLGSYGHDLVPQVNIVTLLKAIASEVSGMRVRISSLDPQEISDEIIDIVARNPVFCRHFHIPLQSGDDGILKRMFRNYDAERFVRVVNKIKERIPEAGIGIDVIAGFPGEGENQFRSTLELIRSLPISYLHVFPFSLRKGTAAVNFPERVDGKVIRKRVRELIELGKTKRKEYYSSFIGKILEVIPENEKESGHFRGFSDNYIPVLIKGKNIQPGELLRVKITDLDGFSVYGERV